MVGSLGGPSPVNANQISNHKLNADEIYSHQAVKSIKIESSKAFVCEIMAFDKVQENHGSSVYLNHGNVGNSRANLSSSAGAK